MKKLGFMLAMVVCIFAGCSDDDSVKNPEIIINSDIIWNGLSFGVMEEEQSISFSVNTDWALSITSASGSVDWCKASAMSGNEGLITVKFSVSENKDYEERSVFVTIRADVLEETFMITQKASDALLVTTDKYEVPQEGGQIEVEVKANIDYQIKISEDAKSWITERYSRTLTTRKYVFDVAINTSTEERKGEIIFRNGDKEEMVKVSQEGITIVSVTLKEAGTLKSAMGDNYLNIRSLKIVGPINGDDVYCLRRMLGGSEFNETNWGKLTMLDLSEAIIVKGGGWYLDTDHYTSDNTIGNDMFYKCDLLENIYLPISITSIGESAFFRCFSLISITIPDSVVKIGSGAFHGCYNLASVTIGKAVEVIWPGAFYGCNNLNSVYIKNLSSWCKINFENAGSVGNPLEYGGILYIENNEITELTIPKDIKEIKAGVFMGCGSLIKVIIGDNVTSIGRAAFKGCRNLTFVVIGKNVKEIGESFWDVPITDLYCYAETPPIITDYTFGAIRDKATLYVPKDCKTAYKSSDWGRFFDNIIEMK